MRTPSPQSTSCDGHRPDWPFWRALSQRSYAKLPTGYTGFSRGFGYPNLFSVVEWNVLNDHGSASATKLASPSEGSFIERAVDIVIGAAIGKISSLFLRDIDMPPIGLLLGDIEFGERFINRI